MPNIRILALAVLQIFCSQGCSYIVEKGHKSRTTRPMEEKRYGSAYLSCKYAKYQDPSKRGSSNILFTRLFLYKMPVSEKGK